MSPLQKKLFCFTILGMLFLTLVVDAEAQAKREEISVAFEEGIIFYNGEFIESPYLIRVTSESVFINDIELPSTIAVQFNEDVVPEGFDGVREDFFRSERFGSRRRNSSPSPVFTMGRHLIAALDRSEVIVLFDGQPFFSFTSASEQYDFCQAMLADNPDLEKLILFENHFLTAESKSIWKDWIPNYVPSAQVAARMESFISQLDKLEKDARDKMAATQRLETLAYPLTLIGMILSVIAFGQLLQWIGKGFAENEEPKPESERYLVMALLLMLGMSLVDLAWTILAGQAGVMREVNPVAAMYMDSPQQLAIFKVVATCFGFSILYIWRQKPLMQQATWWMCLVCVLVTFRWVIFNSMMS